MAVMKEMLMDEVEKNLNKMWEKDLSDTEFITQEVTQIYREYWELTQKWAVLVATLERLEDNYNDVDVIFDTCCDKNEDFKEMYLELEKSL